MFDIIAPPGFAAEEYPAVKKAVPDDVISRATQENRDRLEKAAKDEKQSPEARAEFQRKAKLSAIWRGAREEEVGT